MAERRMFAKTIIDSDAFLDMPLSSQCLYFHLSMRADDEGFINNPKKIQRMIGASEDDLKLLLAKNFLISFDTGVVVIKHWKIHNYIQSDRFKKTVYTEERAMLKEKENKAYTLCIQDVSNSDTQDRLEIELGKSKDSKEDIHRLARQDIIAYLNDKTSSHFRDCKSTQRLIDARLNDGYTFEDFKKVIDTKCEQWLMDSALAKYLRPETLFNATHFESYLNEVDPWEKAKEMYGAE